VVWHVVLAQPKPGLTRDDRAAFLAAFRQALAAIPSVRGVRVGRRVRHGAGYEPQMPDAADYIALLEFDDLEGLQAYLHDRAHEEVAAWFARALQSALVYDFEESTLDDLI
jgi:hypothetical protein